MDEASLFFFLSLLLLHKFQLFQYHLLKRLVFSSSFIAFYSFVKTQVLYKNGFVSDSLFCSIVLFVILVLLDNKSFFSFSFGVLD